MLFHAHETSLLASISRYYHDELVNIEEIFFYIQRESNLLILLINFTYIFIIIVIVMLLIYSILFISLISFFSLAFVELAVAVTVVVDRFC